MMIQELFSLTKDFNVGMYDYAHHSDYKRANIDHHKLLVPVVLMFVYREKWSVNCFTKNGNGFRK